jgi:hypothetical protein
LRASSRRRRTFPNGRDTPIFMGAHRERSGLRPGIHRLRFFLIWVAPFPPWSRSATSRRPRPRPGPGPRHAANPAATTDRPHASEFEACRGPRMARPLLLCVYQEACSRPPVGCPLGEARLGLAPLTLTVAYPAVEFPSALFPYSIGASSTASRPSRRRRGDRSPA